MTIGIAADHGGFELKQVLAGFLNEGNHTLIDFGADELQPLDDYPDYVIPLARAVADKKVERGIAVCGSGIGAAIAANKIAGVRACLITETFGARQGVEDDDMNLLCLGGRITAAKDAKELVALFLGARFRTEEKYLRRLQKIFEIEKR